MLAALWQGELVAALGAVAEEVGFPETRTRIKPAEVSLLKLRRGRKEIAALSKSFLRRCLEGGGVRDYS